MPGISRNGDLGATGHGCSKVAPVRATQKTVFANGKPILKRGDPMAPHEILVPAIPPICLKHKANLKGADLSYVDLTYTDLYRADLTDVIFNEYTEWPE